MAKRKPMAIQSKLESKLNHLKACITDGADEDAQEHLFDLLRALRLWKTPNEYLTPEGRELRELID